MNINLRQELEELLTLSLEKKANQEQVQRLNSILENHPEAVHYCREFYSMVACLRIDIKFSEVCIEEYYDAYETQTLLLEKYAHFEKTAPVVESQTIQQQVEIPRPIRTKTRSYRKQLSNKDRFMFLFKAAAIVMLAVSVVLLDRWSGRFFHIKPPQSIARISRAVDAQWQEVTGQVTVGSELYAGPMSLIKGFAEITLDNGIRVLLEAPVKMDLEEEGWIYLEKGRLVANIEQSTQKRFVVRTPSATIVDFGTEFGVEVDSEGMTYTHVFQGKVELRQGSDPLAYNNRLELAAGQSGRIKSLGEPVLVETDSESESLRFISIMPTAYELAVKKTKPLFYWRFDRDKDGLIRNEMDPELNEECKLFGSSGYSDGPDLGGDENVAFHCTGHGDDYAILRRFTREVDGGSFSMAMWIRPEKPDDSSNMYTIMRVVTEKGGFAGRKEFGLDDKNRFVLLMNNIFEISEDSSEKSYSNRTFTSKPIKNYKWHHLVVSYKKNEPVEFYINGQLSLSSPIIGEFAIPNKTLYWIIGLTKAGGATHKPFKGSIDEISHYDRKLTAEEVRMLYEASEKKQ